MESEKEVHSFLCKHWLFIYRVFAVLRAIRFFKRRTYTLEYIVKRELIPVFNGIDGSRHTIFSNQYYELLQTQGEFWVLLSGEESFIRFHVHLLTLYRL